MDDGDEEEVVAVERFFEAVSLDLTPEQVSAVIAVASRPIGDTPCFAYGDLAHLLAAYGFRDEVRPPQNSANFQFDTLDTRSIRIMNRLAAHMEPNSTITELIGS